MKSTIKLLLGNGYVLVMLLLITEVTFRSLGYSPYKHQLITDIEVNPGDKFFQRDSLLGYKHLVGEYNVTIKNKLAFTTTHGANTLRITSPQTDTIDLTKPEIWIFGCSFTYGWSINDAETYAWRLQSQLPDYRVINWGVGGYGTIHFLYQLENALKSLKKPKLVIVNHADFHFERNVFSYNRQFNTSQYSSLGRLNQPYANLSDSGGLIPKRSKGEYVPWNLSKISAMVFFTERRYENFLDGGLHSESREIARLIFDRIVNLCNDNDVKLLITNVGQNEKFIKNYSFKNEIPYVDISVNVEDNKYNNQPNDKHPNAEANRVYAEKLYTYLSQNLLELQRPYKITTR